MASVAAAMACAALAQQPASVSASFAHIAFGGTHTPDATDTWSTELVFTNLGANPASVGLRWFGETGQPLTVPVLGGSRSTSHQFQVAPNSTLDIHLDDSVDALTVGWVAVDISGSVEGQGIYHSNVTGRPEYIAAAPMMHHGAATGLLLMGGGVPVATIPTPRSLALPFNNVNHATGVAFANITSASQILAIDYLDDSGTVLMSQSIPLAPDAHVAFATTDPRIASSQGIIRVNGDASAYSAIAFVMGTGSAGGTLATLLPVVQ
jgi:hypothetical protein